MFQNIFLNLKPHAQMVNYSRTRLAEIADDKELLAAEEEMLLVQLEEAGFNICVECHGCGGHEDPCETCDDKGVVPREKKKKKNQKRS